MIHVPIVGFPRGGRWELRNLSIEVSFLLLAIMIGSGRIFRFFVFVSFPPSR